MGLPFSPTLTPASEGEGKSHKPAKNKGPMTKDNWQPATRHPSQRGRKSNIEHRTSNVEWESTLTPARGSSPGQALSRL